MKVILLQDVEKLGAEGDIVTVKDGFGRNYLIPQGWALMATQGAVKARREEMRQQVRRRAQEKENAQDFKNQLELAEVVVEVKVGEENRIFGTVTPQQVALKLAMQGFQIDRRNIELSEEIRLIGVYSAQVKIFSDVFAQVKVRVVPEGGALLPEAEAPEAEAPEAEAPEAEAPEAEALEAEEPEAEEPEAEAPEAEEPEAEEPEAKDGAEA